MVCERDIHSKTRHKLLFEVPETESTKAKKRNPDKVALRNKILHLREQGMSLSYREIAKEVGLHHSRVWQIVKLMNI